MLKLLGTGLVLGTLSLAALVSERDGGEGVVQPLGFNHALHMEEDLTCLECHLHAADGPVATLPLTKVCMLCHEEPQGEDPEEPKVREFAEQGDFIPWTVVNVSDGHVYFSHEAHVTWAAMECDECHGDSASLTEPLTESQVEWMDMAVCMDCHTERGASNDCNLCHK